MIFDVEFALEILPELLSAARITLAATTLGTLLAMALGLVWVVLRRSPSRAISTAAHVWVEFIRRTPLLIQIYFLFYIFPQFGVELSPMLTGVLALGLHYSMYLAEVYRAGIEAVPKGQWEAARALNFSNVQTWRTIVLPQAIPPVIPAIGNYVIAMFKDTPLLSVITLVELLSRAKIIGSVTFRYVEPLTMVGILFLIFSLLASAGVRWTESKLNLQAVAP
jgi:polar amino acid transport system permease protein